MSGNDFYDKQQAVREILGPLFEEGVFIADPEGRRLLGAILAELKAIHWHLAMITENDPDSVRRDAE